MPYNTLAVDCQRGAAAGVGGGADASRGREQHNGLLRREINAPSASCATSTVVGATSSTLAPMPLTGDHDGDGEVVLEGWLLKTPRHRLPRPTSNPPPLHLADTPPPLPLRLAPLHNYTTTSEGRYHYTARPHTTTITTCAHPGTSSRRAAATSVCCAAHG